MPRLEALAILGTLFDTDHLPSSLTRLEMADEDWDDMHAMISADGLGRLTRLQDLKLFNGVAGDDMDPTALAGLQSTLRSLTLHTAAIHNGHGVEPPWYPYDKTEKWLVAELFVNLTSLRLMGEPRALVDNLELLATHPPPILRELALLAAEAVRGEPLPLPWSGSLDSARIASGLPPIADVVHAAASAAPSLTTVTIRGMLLESSSVAQLARRAPGLTLDNREIAYDRLLCINL